MNKLQEKSMLIAVEYITNRASDESLAKFINSGILNTNDDL